MTSIEYRALIRRNGAANDETSPDTRMSSISIIVPPEDVEPVAAALIAADIKVTKPAALGFDGAQVLSLVVELTPPVATFLAGLYAARLKANRHTVLKMKGLEVRGVSEEALLKLADAQRTTKD
jgi:hypothetical protein